MNALVLIIMERCPITLCALHELSLPVAFASAPDQPYELEALCAWLERSPINPLTGVEADVGELVPLGDSRQQERSVGILCTRGLTIFETQVNFCPWKRLWRCSRS